MTDARPASRRSRLWVDPRLLVGLGLVIASVAGVVALVGTADRRVPVYAAAETLAPGAELRDDQLLVRWVALDDADSLYLAASGPPQQGLIIAEVVRRGELVPRAAVATADGSDSTTIVVQVSGGVSESIVPGARVDVWASARVDGAVDAGISGGFAAPSVLTSDARVVRVTEPDGIVTAADGRSVEVLVPRSRVARLLHAIANGDALAVVAAGIPLSAP
jgi:hypothetical protein